MLKGAAQARKKMFFRLKKGYIILFLIVGVIMAITFSDHLGATTKIRESVAIMTEKVGDIFELLSVNTVTGTQVKSGEEPIIERGDGFLSLEAIDRLASYDFDKDGYVGLDDLAPGNPYAYSEADLADEDNDGYEAWQDIDDYNPSVHLKGRPEIDNYPKLPDKAKMLNQFLKEHPTREKITDALLKGNEKYNRPYRPEEIIDWAKTSGDISSEKIKEWEAKYESYEKLD